RRPHKNRGRSARRCRHGATGEVLRPQDFLPLRRRRRPHPHVPHLVADERRLDEESGAAVPPAAEPGTLALGGVRADYWKLDCRDLGHPVWQAQPRAANGAAYDYSVWLVLDTNPQSAFSRSIQFAGDRWTSVVGLPLVALGRRSAQSRGSLERSGIRLCLRT